MNKKMMTIEYLRLSGYALVFLLAAILLSGIGFAFAQSAPSVARAGQDKPFEGGSFEASGVVQVPGTSGFLFIDDGRPGEIFWMELDASGKQLGSIKAVKLGVHIEDPEGITTDGTHFYIVGSQSKGKGAQQVGLARFKFDPKTQSVAEVQTVSELKKYLTENVAELREPGAKTARKDGINIEGLAWDAQGERLLLGLRSPLVDGQALVIALPMKEARGPFSADNIKTAETKAIKLALGGLGIRSMEYDSRSQAFRIIAGATESQAKTDFRLLEWKDGKEHKALREVTTFDKALKPEGITGATVGNKSFMFVVFDTSRYLRLE
jgi:hypothetical protein